MPPNNPLTVWGNEKTMNLNTLVLTNIQSSPYFKVNLFELKTYHEVIDEIYYKVSHLEPWEKGSRKTAGQTGMCGGVRGVGAGGIVSSAFCLLYKLFTLKLTKKQVIGLITHKDSPYIRGLGFMYIRYTQPPADLWPWYEDYLDDEEEIDVKAGGGHIMTIGEMLRQWLVKLEWYSTLFPRIPVPIEKDLAAKLKTRPVIYNEPEPEPEHIPDNEVSFGEAERRGGQRDNGRAEYNNSSRGGGGGGGGYRGSRDYSPAPRRSPPPANHRNRRSPSPTHQRSSASRRSPPPPPRRTPPRSSDYSSSFERDLARERERQQRETRDKDRRRSRSRSPKDRRDRRSRSRDRKEKRSRSLERKEQRSRSQEKRERRSRSRDRDRKESSSHHKRSHKDKKDKHRDREEKSHKHKSRDKEYR